MRNFKGKICMAWHYDWGFGAIPGPSAKDLRQKPSPNCRRRVKRCVYTPHSLRATTATLLLDAGVDIIKVKELLGHRHVTTQIYDKRRRSLKEGASHDVPI
jgi:integrase